MKKLLTYSCAALSACSLFAESDWVATIEVDSVLTLQTGIASFCKASDIPLSLGDISKLTTDTLKEVLPLASPDTAISFRDPIRIFVLEDAGQPLSKGGAPVLLFALTLPNDAKILMNQLAQVYGERRNAGNITTFSDPSGNNAAIPKNLLVSVADHDKAMVATSEAAFAWFKQQQKLDSFLPVAGNQALRACVNVKQVAGLMQALPDGQPNPFAAICGDIDYLSLALTPNAQAVTVNCGMRAKAGSVIATLLDTMKPPDAALWSGLPENAFFADAGQQMQSELSLQFVKTYLNQDIPVDPIRMKLEKALTGSRIQYIAPTADKKSLRLVGAEAVKDATVVATLKEVAQMFDQLKIPGFGFKKESPRKIGQLTVERYSLVIDPAALLQAQGVDPAVVNPATNPALMLLPAIAKNIIFECAVKDNYLIYSWGSASATDNWIPAFPAAAVTLDQKIAALDPAAKPLLGAFEFRVTPLLKQIVSMLPNMKPEHLKLFSATPDPIQGWTAHAADNTTVVTLRIPANEVASIMKIVTNGQTLLQEIILSIVAAQMQQLMAPQPAAIPPPNF